MTLPETCGRNAPSQALAEFVKYLEEQSLPCTDQKRRCDMIGAMGVDQMHRNGALGAAMIAPFDACEPSGAGIQQRQWLPPEAFQQARSWSSMNLFAWDTVLQCFFFECLRCLLKRGCISQCMTFVINLVGKICDSLARCFGSLKQNFLFSSPRFLNN